MKKICLTYINAFFGKELELRVRLFHVLAITGVILCIAMTGVSIVGRMWVSMVINMGAGAASLFLLLYSAKTRRYQLCYCLTIAVIFFLLFPSLFFSGGGYRGGMPFFFVFAIVFTVYMLDGWVMLGVTALELVFYSVLCVAAYRRPDLVIPFQSEEAVVTDVIIGLVSVGISLGATMFVQVHMYQKQQRELEEAQHRAEGASRAKSAFLANMSHEIRTPIHMIVSMNEIIQRESRSTQVLEYSEKIDETSKMLLSLVDSVLDVSKIESGKMELIPAPYETEELVKNLGLIGWTYCKRRGLEFRKEVGEDLPPALYGDMAHIRQIASNFLSNAAKYTRKGAVTLAVYWEPGRRPGEILLCISVRDTGIGIRREVIPTLFESFNRVDLAAHRDIEGTGLGLTIVKGLTSLMNGTLSVTSEPGKGSAFTVKVPQRVLNEQRPRQEHRQVSFRAPEVRLLVVDDNEGNRAVLRELLVPSGVQVDTAASGAECIRMVEEHPYHLILMDYMMPELDGLETVEQLRARPGFHTPVIGLTADATPETRQKMKKGGFAACLTKPVPWARLKEVLLTHLPPELVTLTEEKSSDGAGCDREMAELLEPYGIYPQDAMEYFENRMERYTELAVLFLRHNGEERRKVEELWAARDYAGLRFPIHALKGKARNLGIRRLSELCAYLETLCKGEQVEEIDSIMPYLFFLWRKGDAGLAVLVRDRPPEPIRPQTPETDPKELPDLLRRFRRKPSLDCIDALLAGEPSEEGTRRLKQVRARVEQIDFDAAAAEYAAYLAWREKGEPK